MAFRKSDLPDVFMALEAALGPDTGINGYAWNVCSVTGIGPVNSRVYYVIAQQYTNITYIGKPFVLVIVTLVPGIPRHTAVLQATGLANATMDGCMTSAAAAILASGVVENVQAGGVALALNV